jgi:hypothetical protein
MRSLQRRQFLGVVASAAALPVMSRVANAEVYPSRPVRLLVGFAPGGGTDVMARLLQPALSEGLGQQIVIENRPGAGTNIATEALLNAVPDGYTLLAASLANAGTPRQHTGRRHRARPLRIGGKSVLAGEHDPGAHRLCQGPSWQGQHGVRRRWFGQSAYW